MEEGRRVDAEVAQAQPPLLAGEGLERRPQATGDGVLVPGAAAGEGHGRSLPAEEALPQPGNHRSVVLRRQGADDRLPPEGVGAELGRRVALALPGLRPLAVLTGRLAGGVLERAPEGL